MPPVARLLFPPDFPGGAPGQVMQVQNDSTIAWATLAPSVAGLPFTAVDTLAATPRSVTDWGSIINTAIGNGVRKFWFGPFDYPYTTAINFHNVQNVTLKGAGGYNWYDPGTATTYSRLIWNGTTGITDGNQAYAIDCSSTTTGPGGNSAFVAEDMMFLYSATSGWAGGMINFRDSTFDQVFRCFFGSVTGSAVTAYVACHLGNANGVSFYNCEFANHQFYTRGREQDTDKNLAGRAVGFYSQYVSFYDCTFSGDGVGIANPGEKWVCNGCTFEFAGTSTQLISTDYNYATGNGGELALKDCSFWDAVGGTQYLVNIPSGTPISLELTGCRDFGQAGSVLKLINHQGNGSLVMMYNGFSNIIDVGDGTTAGSFKDRVIAIGNSVFYNSATDVFVNFSKGHKHVVVLGNDDTGDAGGNSFAQTYNGLVTLTHERIERPTKYNPTIAVHAGATNINAVGLGSASPNDMAGYISIQTTGAGASSTGLLADVTLGHPVNSLGASGNMPSVGVVLGLPATFVANGIAASPSATWAAQPYLSVADANANTGFSVGVVNAIPLSTTICVPYRFIQL